MFSVRLAHSGDKAQRWGRIILTWAASCRTLLKVCEFVERPKDPHES